MCNSSHVQPHRSITATHNALQLRCLQWQSSSTHRLLNISSIRCNGSSCWAGLPREFNPYCHAWQGVWGDQTPSATDRQCINTIQGLLYNTPEAYLLQQVWHVYTPKWHQNSSPKGWLFKILYSGSLTPNLKIDSNKKTDLSVKLVVAKVKWRIDWAERFKININFLFLSFVRHYGATINN